MFLWKTQRGETELQQIQTLSLGSHLVLFRLLYVLLGFSQSVATELAAQGSPCCVLKSYKVTADPSNHAADSQHIAISAAQRQTL